MSTRSARLAVLSLALVLALAGCVGPVVEFSEQRPSTPVPTADSDAPATASSPMPGPTVTGGGATTTATAAPEARNPWGRKPIVVAVEDPANTGREWTPLVREAAAYWERRGERFTGFPVDYEVRPNADDPDLVVQFVDTVPECDGADDAAGCAPLIENRRQIDRPETVSVRTGFSDDSTVLVVKHELGHTLGLRHTDAPKDVMASSSVLYTEPLPDAEDRAFPWDDGDFTVYVDTANATDPAAARQQAHHALGYYERGAPGMPSNLSFTMVDDADDADIVVQSVETSPCRSDAASCGGTVGWDPDGDDAVETYSKLRISLVDLDTDAVAWHVGYWLAYGLGAEDDSDKPEPFRDATYEERRSEWWE